MSESKLKSPRVYYGWYILGTAMFIAFVTTGARNGFGVFVIPMSEEFEWNRTTISVVAAVGWLVNGITQPFLGHFFDRFSARRVILVSLVVVGASTAALSLTFHVLFLAFLFGFVLSTGLSGASTGTLQPLLARWFQRRRTTMMGFIVAGSSVGGLILVPFSAYLLELTDWRITWVALGGAVLVLATPLAFFLLRSGPEEMGLEPDGGAGSVESGDTPVERRRGLFEVDNWRDSFRSPPMWQLSAAYTVCGVTTGIISIHFIPYAQDLGLSATRAAAIFGFMMALNVVGGIGAGMLADRFGQKNVLGTVYFVRGLAYMMLLVFPGEMSLWVFAYPGRVLLDCQCAGDHVPHCQRLRAAVPRHHRRHLVSLPPDRSVRQHKLRRDTLRCYRLLHAALCHRWGVAVPGGTGGLHHQRKKVLCSLPGSPGQCLALQRGFIE